MFADLQKYNKTIAGFVAALLVGFMYKNNIAISDELNDAIELILGAVVTAVIVWLSPKNKAA